MLDCKNPSTRQDKMAAMIAMAVTMAIIAMAVTMAIIAMAVTMAIIIAMLMVKATMETRAMKAMLALPP